MLTRYDHDPSDPRPSAAGTGIASAAVSAVLALILVVSSAGPASGQQTGWVAGIVEDDGGEPLVGASVTVEGTGTGVLTTGDGTFLLGPVPAGDWQVRASTLGYSDATRSIRVAAGDTVRVRLALAPRPVALAGVDVSVLRPDMEPETRVEERTIREANPRDVGELLRDLPGMSSVRRGPLGLDPVVRGLRETEVGVYLDGTRMFPAGPARMDSPLTHLDPSALQNIQVVKGPYALTWGAGNMSAIRVETQPVPPPVPGPFHGRILSGYDTNLGAGEVAASFFGNRGRASYWLHGSLREGDDYETGGGQVVPAGFLSREGRGKIGYRVAPGSHVVLSAGYQEQRDIDYPGRLLNADFFETYNLSARWTIERSSGLLRSLDAHAYVNDVSHGMDNEGKPNEGMADVTVSSAVTVRGGRLAATLAPGDVWEVELGGDLYRAHRNAVRTLVMHAMDMTMVDLMWPDATITDAGAFARVARPMGERASVAATLRLDAVQAAADTASPFFLENASSDLDATELNLSGALTVSTLLSPHWSAAAGLGTVVRTADATERYSDRIPASKAQMSTEFMGDPTLAPERSTQADLWIEGDYPGLRLQLNAFARRIDDYITVAPTELPSRLPLTPDTVLRYVNGEATFRGAEAVASFTVAGPLSATVRGSYLWARDVTLDEPALGIAPLRGDLDLRYEPEDGPFFVEASLHAVGEQDRVATSRGEVPTDGYTTADVQAGVQLFDRALLRVGVSNIGDERYINHLNAKNPFSGDRIPEPGRVLFARVNYTF